MYTCGDLISKVRLDRNTSSFQEAIHHDSGDCIQFEVVIQHKVALLLEFESKELSNGRLADFRFTTDSKNTMCLKRFLQVSHVRRSQRRIDSLVYCRMPCGQWPLQRAW